MIYLDRALGMTPNADVYRVGAAPKLYYTLSIYIYIYKCVCVCVEIEVKRCEVLQSRSNPKV